MLLQRYCGLLVAAGSAWARHPTRTVAAALYSYQTGNTTALTRDLRRVLDFTTEARTLIANTPTRAFNFQGPPRTPAFLQFAVKAK